jgi:hypothetical protein
MFRFEVFCWRPFETKDSPRLMLACKPDPADAETITGILLIFVCNLSHSRNSQTTDVAAYNFKKKRI